MQFNRRAKLRVGNREWTELRLVLVVEAGDSSKPSRLTAEIYNLSDDSAGYLSTSEDLTADFFAGYDTPSLIGSGDVQRVETDWRGPDRITRIECADGGKQNAKRVQVAESGQVSTRGMIGKIADKMGFSGVEFGKIDDVKLPNGLVFSGPGREQIDALAKTSGAKVHTNLGRLIVLPTGGSLDKSATLITPDTGLIGSPQRTEEGIKFTCLLNPHIVPRRIVKVQSREISGFYIVRSYRHSADTHGQDWTTEVEAVRRG